MSENNGHKEAVLSRAIVYAGFHGDGFELFEHWENDGRDLLLVTSDPSSIELKPGDVIVRRTWSAVGRETVYNSARTHQ